MQKRLMLVPLIALTLGGCSLPFVGNNKNVVQEVAQKTEEKAAEQAVLANCKYDKDVCKYFAAMMTAYSQPLVMKTTTGSDVSTVKMDGKGNMDIIGTKNGKEDNAMIVLDKTTYIKDYKDNTWLKMTASDDAEKGKASLFDPAAVVEEFKKQAEDTVNQMTIKKLGEEACGSLSCLKYQMDEPTYKTTSTVWFDTKAYKSRKMETGLNGSITTIEYSYENVTIVAPTPTKDAPDYSKALKDSGVTMPSTADLEKMMKELPQQDGQ